MYKVQVTFKTGSWERCVILESQKTEDMAIALASKFLVNECLYDNNAEIWTLAPKSKLWRVEDKYGRIVHRPVTEV